MYKITIYEVGDRVYYVDNGPEDVGTVTGYDADEGGYLVDFDDAYLLGTGAYVPSLLHIAED